MFLTAFTLGNCIGIDPLFTDAKGDTTLVPLLRVYFLRNRMGAGVSAERRVRQALMR